jgi:hypothetical protein
VSSAIDRIPLGSAGSSELVVGPDHLANRFKDATLPPALATPVMIMTKENAAPKAKAGQPQRAGRPFRCPAVSVN